MASTPRLSTAICFAAVAMLAPASAFAQATCTAVFGNTSKPVPSSTSLLTLIDNVAEGTTWAGLPADVRATLQKAADDRLAWFRAEWSRPALLRKESILSDCPTVNMTQSIDRYLRQEIADNAPDFSLTTVSNTAFRRALTRLYLSSFAAYRARITYPTGALPNVDWDGVTPFSSFPLPDAATYADIRAHADEVIRDLQAIPEALLNAAERSWRKAALISARKIRSGGFVTMRGGQDWMLPCQLSGAGDLIAMAYGSDEGTPAIYQNHEEALAEFNAMYLNNVPLKWVDRGTLPTARDNSLCNNSIEDDIKQLVEPHSAAAARAMRMLRGWWFERAGVSLPPYSLYSSADRNELWEAFTAEQRTVNDGTTSMATYAAQAEAFRREKVATYREIAASAVDAVFPDDSILSAAQRGSVLSAIAREEGFGRIKDLIGEMLDEAQGTQNGPAAVVWRTALARHVRTLGGVQGDGTVPAEDLARAKTMFDEVQAWLAKRYSNYPQPIAEALAKVRITFTDGGGATTNVLGEIKFGLGTPRSELEYYSLMLHELRHAIRTATIANSSDPSNVATDDGIAIEGSGVAAEDMLRVQLLRDVLRDELPVLLYQLDFAIRDARFIATTEATLKRYTREPCSTAASCPDTNEAARAIAHQYGLTGPLADTLVARSHLGTQYFQYIFAGEQMKAELAALSREIDEPERQIDPFMLFGCGLNTPRHDAEYVSELKKCLATVSGP